MARGSGTSANGNHLLFGSRSSSKIKPVDLSNLVSSNETIGLEYHKGYIVVSKIPEFIKGDLWLRGEALLETEDDFDEYQNDIGVKISRKPGQDFIAIYEKRPEQGVHAFAGSTPQEVLEQLSADMESLEKAPRIFGEDWLTTPRSSRARQAICHPTTKQAIFISALDNDALIPSWQYAHFEPRFNSEHRIYQAPWYSEAKPSREIFLVIKEYQYGEGYYEEPMNTEVIGAYAEYEDAIEFSQYQQAISDDFEPRNPQPETTDTNYKVHRIKLI